MLSKQFLYSIKKLTLDISAALFCCILPLFFAFFEALIPQILTSGKIANTCFNISVSDRYRKMHRTADYRASVNSSCPRVGWEKNLSECETESAAQTRNISCLLLSLLSSLLPFLWFFPHLSISSFTVQNTNKTVFNEISVVFGSDASATWVTLLQMLTWKCRDWELKLKSIAVQLQSCQMYHCSCYLVYNWYQLIE